MKANITWAKAVLNTGEVRFYGTAIHSNIISANLYGRKITLDLTQASFYSM